MKKLTAILLASNIMLSMTSCDFMKNFDDLKSKDPNINITDEKEDRDEANTSESSEKRNEGSPEASREGSEKPEKTPTDESTERVEGTKYYKIEYLLLTTVRYSIYDSNGTVVLCEETDRPLEISMLGEDIVDICIGMGTGINVHKYYDVQNNRFSEEYSYVAASSGNLVAYIEGNSLSDRELVVRDIFDKNVFYKSFGLDFSPTVHDPIEAAIFTNGEAELNLVYLSERPPVSLSVTLPIRRASNEGEILSPDVIAMETYEAFLKNEIKTEFGYLKNYQEEYLMNYLWEWNGSIRYAYVDMDGDGRVELLVSGIDTFVFSYSHRYNRINWRNLYNFREMNRVYVDGSYSWNYGSSDGVSYGIKKNGKNIWRIENEGGSYTLYYIGEKSVTKEELLRYLEDNPTPEEVKFTAISGEGWNQVIDKERAKEIASEYWINEQTGKDYRILVSGQSAERYCVRLCTGSYYETDIDAILIDAITGEIIVPDDKG